MEVADITMKARVVPVGSAYEGTKVSLPDEFDFNVVLEEFSDVCEVCSSPVCPPGYVLLRRRRDSSTTTPGLTSTSTSTDIS